jgi:hypothetical protein
MCLESPLQVIFVSGSGWLSEYAKINVILWACMYYEDWKLLLLTREVCSSLCLDYMDGFRLWFFNWLFLVVGFSSSFASLTLKDSQDSHYLVPHGSRWVCLVHATLVSLTRKVVPPFSYIHIFSLSQKQDSRKCSVLENRQTHVM